MASPATATVVGFDDLVGSGTVPDGYGGIIWGGNFSYYDFEQPPYTPSSPFTRIYTNYALHPTDGPSLLTFQFTAPVTFQGLFAAGAGSDTVSYDLFNAGSPVGSSAAIITTEVPFFLTSGYGGLIDEVRINQTNVFSVYDDVTYSSAVPEPATWAMMIAGFGLVGAGLRRRTMTVRYA